MRTLPQAVLTVILIALLCLAGCAALKAEPPQDALTLPQDALISQCGPSCDCGCNEGQPCTCAVREARRAYVARKAVERAVTDTGRRVIRVASVSEDRPKKMRMKPRPRAIRQQFFVPAARSFSGGGRCGGG